MFVTDAQVLANRPHGVVDGPLQVISDIAFTIVSAAYLGVAEARLPGRARHRGQTGPTSGWCSGSSG